MVKPLDPKPIRTIVFDLDDTLRYNEPHAHAFISDFAETLRGRPLTPAERRAGQLWEHQYWASSDDLKADITAYKEGTQEFWVNYGVRSLLSLGFDEPQAQQYAAQVHEYMRENYSPVSHVLPETRAALATLRQRGYRIGLLTNRPKPVHAEMNAMALDLHMDFFLAASQLGAYKPDKEIFLRMIEFLGVSKDSVLYVGDNYYADVLGARGAGLQCLLLNWNSLYEDPDVGQISAIADLLDLLPGPLAAQPAA
ncbi:MAG: HAD family hydrolase [Anaerolineales bacterium]|nr:MAG: HAD family hydrolase [Anaerolineales bacterium]